MDSLSQVNQAILKTGLFLTNQCAPEMINKGEPRRHSCEHSTEPQVFGLIQHRVPLGLSASLIAAAYAAIVSTTAEQSFPAISAFLSDTS